MLLPPSRKLSRSGQPTLQCTDTPFPNQELNKGALLSAQEPAPSQPHLKRVLGRWDLVLLFVVAVFNLNVVPSIAANGGVTIWLWIISIVLFFWPQGIAVIELSHRYPGEGGVYLWAKEEFGDFHGSVLATKHWRKTRFSRWSLLWACWRCSQS